jgi:hypothetical protein
LSALAIIRSARAAGVNLHITEAGAIKATGQRDAVARWVPALAKHKSEILAALSEPDLAVVETWEERAAHLEYDAGLPRSWAEPFAKILCGIAPGDFDEGRWRRVIDGGMIFADAWAAKAFALGWRPEDVFGLHPFAPAARSDVKGLAWLLADGSRVVAIDAEGADILAPSGARQRFYRREVDR